MQASSFEILFAARLLTGLGFGAALPNVMAVAADVSRPERRGATSAMMFCGMPAGGSVVALLSWLVFRGEWRPLFVIGGIIPLILAPLLLFLMVETHRPNRQAHGAMPAWLIAIPLGVAFWLGLDQLGRLPGAGSVGGVIAPWIGGALGLLSAYMIVHREPLFGGKRGLASVLLWLSFVPTLLILHLVLNWLPTLIAAKGLPDSASLASVIFNVLGVIGALAFGTIADRFGLRWPLAIGFAGVIAALIGLGQAAGFAPIMILSGALGFFLLGCNFALYGAAPSYYPAEMRGRGSGAAIAWGRLGSVAGPLAGGFLLQGGAAPADVVYSMAPFAAAAGAGVLLLTYLTRPA